MFIMYNEINSGPLGLWMSSSTRGYEGIDHYICCFTLFGNTIVTVKEPNSPTPLSSPEIEVYPGVSLASSYTETLTSTQLNITCNTRVI